MTKLEKLKAEKKEVLVQVERFERKYKNFNTGWHRVLKRINKEINKLEGKKKTTGKKKKPKMEDIVHIPPEGLEKALEEKE